MKTIKLSLIIDVFFVFFASFFFFYAIFFYGGSGYGLSIFLSVLLSIIISSIYVIISALKKESLILKQNNEILIKKFNYTLFLYSQKQILKLLFNYYQTENSVVIKQNSIILEDENIEIFPIIKHEKICISEVINSYKNTTKNYKTTILGCDFDNEIINFISELNLDIDILTTSEFYKQLKEKDLLPELKDLHINNKKKLTLYVKNIFTKKQAKRFLVSGIIITLLSFFSFYPIYYILFGGLLMITGVLLRVLKKD